MHFRVATIAVIRADEFQTPGSVWVTSAIAAGLLHALLVWWAIAAWQERSAIGEPAPIQLVTLPENSEPVPQSDATDGESTPAPSQDPSADWTAAESGAIAPTTPPVPPTDNGPPIESPNPFPTSTAPVPPVASPTPTPPGDASLPPQPPVQSSPPVSQPPITSPPSPSPAPAPPTSSPSSPAAGPSSPSTTPPSNPGPGSNASPSPESSGVPSSGSGLQSWWSLQPVPGGGSDIHDEMPRLPSGWQDATAQLLTDAGCASDLLAPGASVRLTLWPAVDAEGRIFEFLPWSGNSGVPNRVLQCVEALKTQMPPLIPAQDAGQPIASDEVVLVIELRGTP